MTKNNIITYLIDCIGYGAEELEQKTTGELLDLVEDKNELAEYTA